MEPENVDVEKEENSARAGPRSRRCMRRCVRSYGSRAPPKMRRDRVLGSQSAIKQKGVFATGKNPAVVVAEGSGQMADG